MSGPSLADVRASECHSGRVVVPKPREDQRLIGIVEADEAGVRLRLAGAPAGPERFRTVELREREGDGVRRAVRSDGTSIGR